MLLPHEQTKGGNMLDLVEVWAIQRTPGEPDKLVRTWLPWRVALRGNYELAIGA